MRHHVRLLGATLMASFITAEGAVAGPRDAEVFNKTVEKSSLRSMVLQASLHSRLYLHTRPESTVSSGPRSITSDRSTIKKTRRHICRASSDKRRDHFRFYG